MREFAKILHPEIDKYYLYAESAGGTRVSYLNHAHKDPSILILSIVVVGRGCYHYQQEQYHLVQNVTNYQQQKHIP